MTREKKTKEGTFERINEFRLRSGLTWKEIAKELDLSVSALMMVKTGKRNLSEKVERRFEALSSEKTIPMNTDGLAEMARQQYLLDLEEILDEKLGKLKTEVMTELGRKIGKRGK